MTFNLMVEYQHDPFQAIADPTRRAILARLASGPARVTDLAEPFPMSLNAVSKHIRVLERSSLVRRRVRGREHILELTPEPLAQVYDWVRHYKDFWEGRLDALERFLEATRAPAALDPQSTKEEHDAS